MKRQKNDKLPICVLVMADGKSGFEFNPVQFVSSPTIGIDGRAVVDVHIVCDGATRVLDTTRRVRRRLRQLAAGRP